MQVKAAAAVALLFVLVSFAPMVESDAASGTDVLIDEGDGTTHWTTGSGSDAMGIVTSAAAGLGIEVSVSGGTILVDGKSTMTIGSASTGGSLSESGSTGATVTSSWRLLGWTDGEWNEVEASSSGCSAYALAFYPEGILPVETPDDPVAWTMFRGDSKNTGAQEGYTQSGVEYEPVWSDKGAAFANPLYVSGFIIQKYSTYASGENKGYALLSCIDARTGEHVWDFRFISGMNYESSTPVIVGDHVYVSTMTGYIYKIPWKTGPGENNENVTSIGGTSSADAVQIPSFIKDFDAGNTYDAGCTSLVYNSGAIYATHSNGMVYCFDTDLNLVWSYLLDGGTYFIAPTVVDGHVFTGALNGHLYVFDQGSGALLNDSLIFQVEIRDKMYGGIGQIAAFSSGSSISLIFTVTDGLGMNQANSGIAVYEYDVSSHSLVKRYMNTAMGTFGRYVMPFEGGGYTGAYFTVQDGSQTSLMRISTDGVLERVVDGLAEIHSAGVLVDNRWMYLTSYSSADPIYLVDLQEKKIAGTAYCAPEVRNFNMCEPFILNGVLIGGTDSGIFAIAGDFKPYVPPSNDTGAPIIVYLGIIVLVTLAALAVIWAVIRFVKHEDRPFKYLKDRGIHYLYGDNLSHNTRNKHRLKFVLGIAILLIIVTFTLCICIGSTSVLNPVEAYSALFSAIAKGGNGLDTVETMVFVSRLPRTLAALSVGIGLAIAGSVYQAIIRNPLVDPYIMGVSSGAGIAAIAVIAFDFTFFGLFSNHSIFLIAIAAVVGGLVAFGCTMIIAEKAGGSSINYVLAGVVVGLAFSALQTIMLTMAGNKLSNALSWLYGSFAEVTWAQVGVILFLSVFLSLIPMFWAKEFNLVLLGEDQAREMGLDVRKFNRLMLILASVLTSVCVAFCGVIGFVGLVIPHLCRMILGSDHRMVLPASFCFGAVMLMLADLLSRTGYYGIELPVGAITTIIGIPVFAYLLIKKGRMYDG